MFKNMSTSVNDLKNPIRHWAAFPFLLTLIIISVIVLIAIPFEFRKQLNPQALLITTYVCGVALLFITIVSCLYDCYKECTKPPVIINDGVNNV